MNGRNIRAIVAFVINVFFVFTALFAQCERDVVDKWWANYAQLSFNEVKTVAATSSSLTNWVQFSTRDGSRMIEGFAVKFMPNAFARYETAKKIAIELQRTYNEEFAALGSQISDAYEVRMRFLSRLAKARTDYYRAYSELAHYYFQYKAEILTDADLTKVDAEPICVPIKRFLFDEVKSWTKLKKLETKQVEFALKFMPQTYAQYAGWCRDYERTEQLDRELFADRGKIKGVIDETFALCVYKLQTIARYVNQLVATYNQLCVQYRIGEMDADKLSKLDVELAQCNRAFAEYAPKMMRSAALDPASLIAVNTVPIPGKEYRFGQTEVTQMEWALVMGVNPSRFKYLSNPVESVTWNDCQEFIITLNRLSDVKFRLPTEAEWEYACRAGGTGDWGKRANGEEGPFGVMGWSNQNSGCRRPHVVAMKQPNAWGLYDMHGNVMEWTSTPKPGYPNHFGTRGGSWSGGTSWCASGFVSGCGMHKDDGRKNTGDLGLRLVLEQRSGFW